MAERKLFTPHTDDGTPEGVPLGGSRAEASQRLQIGLIGLALMVLLMGVASVISNRAAVSEEAAVPDAAPTTEPTDPPVPSDPLADAGVVPEVPTEDEGAEGDSEEGDEQTVPDIEPDAGDNDISTN